jgi:hypothetical protein
MMMALLETAVKVHAVSSRQVCDALLSSDHLRYEKADFWVSALKLVRKIIGILYTYFNLFCVGKTSRKFSPLIRSY